MACWRNKTNPAPGKDEDPPYNPNIIDEKETGIDLAALQDFHENFAPWLQPPGLTIKGLPKPFGLELWKTIRRPRTCPNLLR